MWQFPVIPSAERNLKSVNGVLAMILDSPLRFVQNDRINILLKSKMLCRIKCQQSLVSPFANPRFVRLLCDVQFMSVLGNRDIMALT